MRKPRPTKPREEREEMAWEQQGLELWRSLGEPEPPFDPYQLAPHFGLRILVGNQPLPDNKDSYLFRGVRRIYLAPHTSIVQRKFCVAHEVVHWLFPELKLERQVSFIAASLLLPAPRVREHFMDCQDLFELRDRWGPELSLEVITRRKLWFTNIAVSIWDDGALKRVLRSPVLAHKVPHPLEAELAQALFADRSATRIDLHERAYAIAVDNGAVRRVFTVMDKAWLAASR